MHFHGSLLGYVSGVRSLGLRTLTYSRIEILSTKYLNVGLVVSPVRSATGHRVRLLGEGRMWEVLTGTGVEL